MCTPHTAGLRQEVLKAAPDVGGRGAISRRNLDSCPAAVLDPYEAPQFRRVHLNYPIRSDREHDGAVSLGQGP